MSSLSINDADYIGTLSTIQSIENKLITDTNKALIQSNVNINSPGDCLTGAQTNRGYCNNEVCPYIVYDTSKSSKTCYYANRDSGFNQYNIGIDQSASNQFQMNPNDPIKIYLNPENTSVSGERDLERRNIVVRTYEEYVNDLKQKIRDNKIIILMQRDNITREEATRRVDGEDPLVEQAASYRTYLQDAQTKLQSIQQMIRTGNSPSETSEQIASKYTKSLHEKKEEINTNNTELEKEIQNITKEITNMNNLSQKQDYLITSIQSILKMGLFIVAFAFIYTILKKGMVKKSFGQMMPRGFIP
jgi:hypothetical protein